MGARLKCPIPPWFKIREASWDVVSALPVAFSFSLLLSALHQWQQMAEVLNAPFAG